jgi:holo-[acyl-carrier protein] synthase
VIIGVGIDICPVDRIEGIISRQGDGFTRKVYTPLEIAYSKGAAKGERLSARWAAKEAAIKALGAPTGVNWHDISVENRPDGAPLLILQGAAKEAADRLGVKNTLLTMSHAGGMAVAVVILEG